MCLLDGNYMLRLLSKFSNTVVILVLGPIDPSAARHILPHEHLSISSAALGVKYKDEKFKEYENAPVAMENLWWIRYNPYAYLKCLY